MKPVIIIAIAFVLLIPITIFAQEVEVLGYGISLILLNVGMYFAAPIIVIMKIRK